MDVGRVEVVLVALVAVVALVALSLCYIVDFG